MKYLQIDSVIKPAFAAALSVLALAGCQKNGFDAVSDGDECIVKFVPSVAGIEATVKGALINEGGPGAISFDASKSFFVTAWDNAATPNNIIPGTAGTYQEVKMKGTQWSTVYTKDGTEYSKEYLWKKDETKTFYAYANLPESGASITNTSAAGQILTYDVPATAVGQTDILMGFYNGNGKTGPVGSQKMTGTAGIVFSHPLTAVKFKLGTLSGVSTFVVNSISIENVHSSGTAEMTPASADESDPKDRFTWTPTGTTTVSQTISTQPAAAGDQIGEVFLLIPQTFSSTSTARLVFNVTIDETTTINLCQPLIDDEWKAGDTNTYTISYKD